MSEAARIYQEVDFLVPAQRFNIQFSYVSQRGLPFIREFVLRLVHLAPMSKQQIANYFGLSVLEAEEAIGDLAQRDELTLSEDGNLKLTDKAKAYFVDLGVTPQISSILDSGVNLSFDLISFSCLEDEIGSLGWKSGIPLQVDQANSERIVEKQFQLQFSRILDRGFLKKSVTQSEKEQPSVYTVSSVKKLRQFPLRLNTKFKFSEDGERLELEDFESINTSETAHQLIADEIAKFSKSNNLFSVSRSMMQLGDKDTLDVFDRSHNIINPRLLNDLNRLEDHEKRERYTFLGPITSSCNWEMFQEI